MATINRTERLREATKRQIMGVLMDTTNSSNGGAEVVDPSQSTTGKLQDGGGATTTTTTTSAENRVSLMIQDLQKGLDRQLDMIKSDVATWKQEQLQAHSSGMIKIPKATRQMTVKEFNAKYKCNLLDLLQNVRRSNNHHNSFAAATKNNSKPPMTRTVSGTKRERALQTPAPTKGRMMPMQTPGGTIRTVRKGEMMYSLNGSPIDKVDEGGLVATVTKKRKGNSTVAAFDINLGEGNYISLNDPSAIQNLDSNARSSAVSQIKVLQDQMALMMQQLETHEQE